MSIREHLPFGRSSGRSREGGEVALMPFHFLQREMNRLFDGFFRSPFETPALVAEGGWGDFSPRLEVVEDEKGYTVSAELPGMDQKEVQLSLTENQLVLKGEKRTEKKEERKGYFYSERSFGSFERMVPFDVEIDADKAEATFKNGVLTVVLPKSARSVERARTISIKS